MSIATAIVDWIKTNAPEPDVREKVHSGSHLVEDGILDSLSIISLVTWLETEYSVRIEESDFSGNNFDTPTTIASLVERRLATTAKE